MFTVGVGCGVVLSFQEHKVFFWFIKGGKTAGTDLVFKHNKEFFLFKITRGGIIFQEHQNRIINDNKGWFIFLSIIEMDFFLLKRRTKQEQEIEYGEIQIEVKCV